MDVDLKAEAVTFRILYAGPEGATKFLNLRGLHSAAREEERRDLQVLVAEGDRFVNFPFSPRSEPPIGGLKVVFQAIAAPGRVHSRGAQRLLLLTADALVFLPDRGDPAGIETRRAFEEIMDDLEFVGRDPADLPVVVQDYDDGEPRLCARDLPGGSLWPGLSLVPVEGDTIEGVLRVFDVARDAVLTRYGDLDDASADPGRRYQRLRALARPTLRRLERATGVEHDRERLWRGIILVLALLLAAASAVSLAGYL